MVHTEIKKYLKYIYIYYALIYRHKNWIFDFDYFVGS